MHRHNILPKLIEYVRIEILDGTTEEIDGSTPLLEWGILNSMELVRLLDFIRVQFGRGIAAEKLTPSNLRDLDSITTLVLTAEN
ncbi:MAG: acyl carrier protein [Proteobacteria bacterium]|nr:acyl carrier protein [Pseudomonadota bacterium]